MTDISTADRLKIQMDFAAPLLNDLAEILGRDVILTALEQRLQNRIEQARLAGHGNAAPSPERILAGFKDMGEATLDYDVIASDTSNVSINVTECGYATLMAAHNASDFGSLLLCGEDLVLTAYAGTQLSRTQTKMLGGDHCNFVFSPGTPAD